jgi:hypothetical protein
MEGSFVTKRNETVKPSRWKCGLKEKLGAGNPLWRDDAGSRALWAGRLSHTANSLDRLGKYLPDSKLLRGSSLSV